MINKRRRILSIATSRVDVVFSTDLPKKVLVHTLLRNALVREGKKYYAEQMLQLVLGYLKSISRKRNPYVVVKIALESLRPIFELKTKKVAAQKLKVPSYLYIDRSYFYAINWLLDAAKNRVDGVDLPEKIAKEIYDAYNLRGQAFQKKQDLYKELDTSRMYLKLVSN